MCCTPESPELLPLALAAARHDDASASQAAPMKPQRAAVLAQWRVEQIQRESRLTPDQRLTMLEELAQIAYQLHGSQPSLQDESPALLAAVRAQLRAAASGQ